MKIKIMLLIAAAALLITGFISRQQEETHPGKQVFMDSKCTTCHTVQSEGLISKKKDAVDLSSVGTVYQANFLEKFLKKEDKVEDKLHPQTFKGPDEQLEQLVEWLTTLKAEKPEGTGDAKKDPQKLGTPKAEDTDTTNSDKK